MAVFGRRLGAPSGDLRRDIDALYDYMAYLVEQLEYSDQLQKRQIARAENAVAAMAAAAQEQEE